MILQRGQDTLSVLLSTMLVVEKTKGKRISAFPCTVQPSRVVANTSISLLSPCPSSTDSSDLTLHNHNDGCTTNGLTLSESRRAVNERSRPGNLDTALLLGFLS